MPIPQRLQEKHGSSSDHANGKIVEGHDNQLRQIDDVQVLPEAIRLVIQPTPLGIQMSEP